MLTASLIGVIAFGFQMLLLGAILTTGIIQLVKLVKNKLLHH